MVLPQALMEAHDSIAEQDLDVDTIEAVDQDEKTTKLVSLEKTRDMPLVKIHNHASLPTNRLVLRFFILILNFCIQTFKRFLSFCICSGCDGSQRT